jgi:hypothetical protein
MMTLKGHQSDMIIDTQKNVGAESNTITEDKFPSFQTLYKQCKRHTESNREYFEGSR